ICMQKVYPWADYITVNISSPNTPGLRSLQYGESLKRLLETIKREQGLLTQEHQRYVPVAIKIAPDVNEEEISEIANALVDSGVDGGIATNATMGRVAVADHHYGAEAGGLGGGPVTQQSTEVIRLRNHELAGRLPIIGVGGIM